MAFFISYVANKYIEEKDVPCGLSMMDYPETSGNLRKLAA
jgi:hypothetical protein